MQEFVEEYQCVKQPNIEHVNKTTIEIYSEMNDEKSNASVQEIILMKFVLIFEMKIKRY